MAGVKKNRYRLIGFSALILIGAIIILTVFVDRLIQPILKDRLHTLIVQGSDSLYTYTLGNLKVKFFSGSVEVENLHITVDSTRYEYLKSTNALPALTMQMSLGRGYIKGLGIFALFFGKKIKIDEIMSKDANIKLSRHIKKNVTVEKSQPVWKAIRPKIESIYIGSIRLEGIKMLYKNIDTSESVKIKFDRCDAVFRDIRIDSLASTDTSRIGFTRSISLKFDEVKFRTEDSLYKMKAKEISYSSDNKALEIDSFKLQPTQEKEDYYKTATVQKDLYYISFKKIKFVNIRLDHFIYNNIIYADSLLFQRPDVSIYNDKALPPDFTSKIGKYPQQQLLKASSTVIIKNVTATEAKFVYTEKDKVTKLEGVLNFDHINLNAQNITNDSNKIKENSILHATVSGNILGTGTISTQFKFYLDSVNGRYDANGTVQNITAAQLNPIAVPLGNVQLNSFNLSKLEFQIRGSDYEAYSDVNMLYNNLSVTFKKTDKETGETSTKKFLTKLVNRYVLWPANPEAGGKERTARNKRVARLTTEAFFGLLWKTAFAGMQDILMKAGHYD